MNTCGYFQDSAYSCCSHAVISADTQWACYKDTSTAAEQIIFNIIVENGGNFTTVSDSAETLMECVRETSYQAVNGTDRFKAKWATLNDEGEVVADYRPFYEAESISLPASGAKVSCNGSVYSYQEPSGLKIYLYCSLVCNFIFALVVLIVVTYWKGTSNCTRTNSQYEPDEACEVEAGSRCKENLDTRVPKLDARVRKDLPESQKKNNAVWR